MKMDINCTLGCGNIVKEVLRGCVLSDRSACNTRTPTIIAKCFYFLGICNVFIVVNSLRMIAVTLFSLIVFTFASFG